MNTTSRTTLSPRIAYPIAAALIGLALYASGTPSPIYGVYAQVWGLSPAVLTLVYAVYAFGVLTTLVLAGRISDDVGRRPVLLTAIGTIALMTIPFMLARSVAWLLVARAIQGLATGAVMSTASAAMLDLHPRRDPAGVGRANGIVSNVGIGLGVLVSSALVQLAPAPRVLPYAAMLLLVILGWLGVFFMPEPVKDRKRLRLTVERPSVPPVVRRQFLLAALAAIASWSIGGLFLSLGPDLTSAILQNNNVLLSGLPIIVLAGVGALSQVFFGHIAAWKAASRGSIALALGVVSIVGAAAAGSSVLLFAGSAVAGLGFGLAFTGGLRALTAVIPGEHRAAVMAAFYAVAYTAISVPAVAAGFLTEPLGLNTTFEVFGSIVAAVALVVAVEAWRQRPVVRPKSDALPVDASQSAPVGV
jgi:MFS family permease